MYLFKMKKLLLVVFLVLIFLVACKSKEQIGKVTVDANIPANAETFIDLETKTICAENNKPIIREFATTWCVHCQWIKDTYAKVVSDYVKQGKIIAYQWEVDIEDDALTEVKESAVPQAELDVFKKFNPQQSIPTFVFGCRYIRTGNGYEAQGNLAAEEKEFREVIDKLIAMQNN